MDLKDALGNELKIGDTVAFDVMSFKSSYLRTGKIFSIEAGGLRIKYTAKMRWTRRLSVNRSILRKPQDVVKAATP